MRVHRAIGVQSVPMESDFCCVAVILYITGILNEFTEPLEYSQFIWKVISVV